MYLQIKHYLYVILIFSFWASNSYSAINVFSCEPEWASLVQALGGAKVKVFSATTALQDPHHIQARPSLIAKARRADLLICTGAELEAGWLPLLLRKSANGKIMPGQAGYFMATDQVTLLEKPKHLDRTHGDVHADGNPHIHLDPRRILIIAEALSNTLSRIDAEHQDYYQNNWNHFKESWSRAMLKWQQQSQSLQGKKIVVNHNSWVYLENWLKLQRVAILEPKPGIAPNSSHLRQVLTKIKQQPVDMILYASYQNDKSVRWLAKKTQLAVVELAFSTDKDETLFHWYERLLSQLLDSK